MTSWKQHPGRFQVIISHDSKAPGDAEGFAALLDASLTPFIPGKVLVHIDRVSDRCFPW